MSMTRMSKKNFLWVGALTLSAVLVSCGPKDSDKIGEAQLCLDKATQGTAAACMEKIAGIESESASLLRCSAGFIDEGFTQSARFKSALEAIDNSGSSSMESYLGVLAFSSKSTAALNKAFAEETYQECAKSKAKGYMLLGSMAQTATTLSSLVGGSFTNGNQPSDTDISNAITAALGDPASQAAIGSAIVTTYNSSCQTGSPANEDICKDLDAALASVDMNDPTAVGQAALTYWQSH